MVREVTVRRTYKALVTQTWVVEVDDDVEVPTDGDPDPMFDDLVVEGALLYEGVESLEHRDLTLDVQEIRVFD